MIRETGTSPATGIGAVERCVVAEAASATVRGAAAGLVTAPTRAPVGTPAALAGQGVSQVRRSDGPLVTPCAAQLLRLEPSAHPYADPTSSTLAA